MQVNLGKNSTWDTHRRNFVNLRDNLFPHFDRSLSALLDDLHGSGMLQDTLVIVLTGEFGPCTAAASIRTPAAITGAR